MSRSSNYRLKNVKYRKNAEISSENSKFGLKYQNFTINWEARCETQKLAKTTEFGPEPRNVLNTYNLDGEFYSLDQNLEY